MWLQGVPFRETHHISGAAVSLAEQKSCQLWDLTAEDLQGIDARFEDDVSEVWSFEKSASMRDSEGGVSERSLLEQVSKMRAYLNAEKP
jgi:argininosuccinate lyase